MESSLAGAAMEDSAGLRRGSIRMPPKENSFSPLSGPPAEVPASPAQGKLCNGTVASSSLEWNAVNLCVGGEEGGGQ